MYAIAELKPGERGGFQARGAVKQLWQTRDFETMVSGPAETGKTWGTLQYADALLWKYPGAQGVMVRKTYADLVASALRTYLRIIGPESPIKPFGGERPQWFDYPNGSRLWLAGLDNAGKVLSTERDFFYVNQAEELTLEDWETIATRCTGRGAVMPYTRMFGDCNPGGPQHWIKARASTGKLLLLESRHADNPTLYTDDGELTAQGKRTMGVLESLSGVRLLRLAKGIWAAAEGVVYDTYDAATHLIDPFEIPAEWRRIRSIDWGYTNPFVCQWWAIDGDGRMYLYREIYRTGQLVEDLAREIKQLSAGERIEADITDHDAEDRATYDRHCAISRPAFKAIAAGIQAVQARLRGGASARLKIFRNALKNRDESLAAKRKPVSTAEEFDGYVWPKGQDGKPTKEVPVDDNNHGMDAMRYAVAYVDKLRSGPALPTDTVRRIFEYAD